LEEFQTQNFRLKKD